MKFTVITLFPEVVETYFSTGMLWKARQEGLASFEAIDLRDFGLGKRKTVDDTIYGGGDGMLLRIEPLVESIKYAKKSSPEAKVILMSPSKNIWTQKMAENYARSDKDYIFICGRYEGVDARIEKYIDDKISIGQYVLTGGELPSLVVIDSITRLIPGVLGGAESALIESYSEGNNIEYPQYTRPEEFDKQKVPEVLLSGNHAEIKRWRDNNQS